MALNNLEDPRSYNSEPHPPLLPDQLAINGSASRSCLRFSAELERHMVDVEGLRFLYLSRYRKTNIIHPSSATKTNRTLIVTLAYLVNSVEEMLKMLDQAYNKGALDGYCKVKIKHHPWTPIRDNAKKLTVFQKAEEVNVPLTQLWSTSSIVFSDSYTSAGMETIWNGLPLVVFVGNDGLNLSPLLSFDGVTFISSVDKLCDALVDPPAAADLPQDLFFLDEALRRWTSLLGN